MTGHTHKRLFAIGITLALFAGTSWAQPVYLPQILNMRPPTPPLTPTNTPTPTVTPEPTILRPWIDVHVHPRGMHNLCNDFDCIEHSVSLMDELGVRKAILINPPSGTVGTHNKTNESIVQEAFEYRPDRFFLGVGGGLLSPLIQNGPDSMSTADEEYEELLETFDQAVEELLESGQVVAFGETTALHLSMEPGHGYAVKPANSPLFLRLAESAALHNIPIDIHIDVIKEKIETPEFFMNCDHSVIPDYSCNPPFLEENIIAFEAMLAHKRAAKIVLAHVGRDTTGHMTPELIDRLLTEHPNLYISLSPAPGPIFSINAILSKGDLIAHSDWVDLLENFPERAVIGTDTFLSEEETAGRAFGMAQKFLQQLPEDLAYQIGCINPVTIYQLPSGCQSVPADFNDDGSVDTADLDALYVVSDTTVPPTDSRFDLNSDNVINTADLDQWLILAATENGHSSAYLRGDTDLDRDIDLTDYNSLATNFDPIGADGPYLWQDGNTDGDDDVDLADYNALASNFSPAGYGAAPVPEPASLCLLLTALLLLARVRF